MKTRRYRTLESETTTSQPTNGGNPRLSENLIYDIFNDINRFNLIYETYKFDLTATTYVDDNFIATAMDNAGHPNEMEIAIKDPAGSIMSLYLTKGRSIIKITQRESFYNRIILTVNEVLRSRGYPESEQITDITKSILDEINRCLINLKQKNYFI